MVPEERRLQEVLDKAMAALNGDKFRDLFEGRWQLYSEYPSQSEADLGFAKMLEYWTDGDPPLMDALFRRSALYRSKWDEAAARRPMANSQFRGRAVLTGITDVRRHVIERAVEVWVLAPAGLFLVARWPIAGTLESGHAQSAEKTRCEIDEHPEGAGAVHRRVW